MKRKKTTPTKSSQLPQGGKENLPQNMTKIPVASKRRNLEGERKEINHLRYVPNADKTECIIRRLTV